MVSASTSEGTVAFGTYTLVRRIAVGGMAEVFEARDEHGSPCALKIPLPEVARDRAYLEALHHEADVARRLTHEGVVEVRALVEQEGRCGLAMELVDGVGLDSLLRARPAPFPDAAACLGLVVALLDALAHVHGAKDERGAPLGIVHRDVKPENLLVTRDGRVKLLDFGIARSRLSSARTRTGTVKGTLRYLTPEQATGSAIDARTDLYAVALVAFELLCGESYLDAESDLELLRLAEDPPTRPFPENLPSEVRGVLGRCVARFPEERPDSASDVVSVLRPHAASREESERAFAEAIRRLPPPDATSTGWVEVVSPRTSGDEAAGHAPSPPAARSPAPEMRSPAPVMAALGLAVLAVLGFLAYAKFTSPEATATPVSTLAPATPPRPVPTAPTRPNPATAVDDVAAEPIRPVLRTPRATTVRADPRAPTAPPTVAPTAPTSPSAAVAVAPSPPPATRESVRARLAAANAAIRAAADRGADTSRLTARSREALEAYTEGQYERANGLLGGLVDEANRLSPSEP